MCGSTNTGFQLFVAGACLCAVLAGCKGGPKISDKDVRKVEYEQVLTMLADEKFPAVMVDVRSPAAYTREHIRGALSIPLPEMVANDPRLMGDKRIIVYSTGKVTDPLPDAGTKRLLALGYKDVVNYIWGIENWKDMGGQVVSGPSPE